ncbi:MAG: cyclic nucleotide-binding domain-containing protein [Deltaproteobacteria bacterium]|nr:cyclic nucleotide-binding domain-containing protein [Deltaproteobacteria bacterium]
MKTPDVIELLAGAALFSGVARPLLEQVADALGEESHERGTVIFRYGDPGDTMYLVRSGRVRISRTIPGLGEEALAMLGEGGVFGEMALLDDSPRSADAIAQQRCRLLTLERRSFEDLLFLNRDLAHEVLWGLVRMLSARLRETTDKLTMLSGTAKFQ